MNARTALELGQCDDNGSTLSFSHLFTKKPNPRIELSVFKQSLDSKAARGYFKLQA